MFKKLLFLSLLSFLTTFIQAQTNPSCDGKRYVTDLFKDTTRETVQYGANSDLYGNGQYLKMEVIQPKTDTVKRRPLIILAFGGGFLYGMRTEQYMIDLCQTFAVKGYVAVSIDYRLIPFGLYGDPVSSVAVQVQAIQDMRASIRYFVKDAQTINKYKIDTNNIFIGGVSAGAITAMQTAYLDTLRTANIPSGVLDIIRQQGGIDGNSGNPGYKFKIKGVLSLSGGMLSADLFRKGDPAYLSIHGTKDSTLIYGKHAGLDGDGACYVAALAAGVPALHVPVQGGDHVGFYADTSSYLPVVTAFRASSALFMKKLICNESLLPTNNISGNLETEVYPNPTNDVLNVRIADGDYSTNWNTELLDITGKRVAAQKFESNQFSLSRNNIPSGLYFLRITNALNNFSTVKKVFFE